MTVFVLYTLREGISFEEYRRWSLDADQPTLRSFAQITDFRVYTATATTGSMAYTVVEVIEVESTEAWARVTASEAVKALQPAFDRYVNPDSLCILQAEEISA